MDEVCIIETQMSMVQAARNLYIFLDLMGCLNESADLHASFVEAKSQVLECSVCVFSVQCCIEALSFCCCWKDRAQSKCRRERWRQREVSFAVEDSFAVRAWEGVKEVVREGGGWWKGSQQRTHCDVPGLPLDSGCACY